MQTLFFIGAMVAIGYWAFRNGKRLGSKLAYRVGRRHGRGLRKRRRQRNGFLSLHPPRRF
jgi:hypothetical protein